MHRRFKGRCQRLLSKACVVEEEGEDVVAGEHGWTSAATPLGKESSMELTLVRQRPHNGHVQGEGQGRQEEGRRRRCVCKGGPRC